MNKYKKYYGIIIFLVIVIATAFYAVTEIKTKYENSISFDSTIKQLKDDLEKKTSEQQIVDAKIAKIKGSILGAQKKIYAPVESGLDDDSLYFTLYNDMLDLVTKNGIKIKAIQPVLDPQGDPFVENGNKGEKKYFVCDVDLDLVSNYVNLGKLIQDIYSYPSYIKINSLEIKPYNKDKKILLTKLSVRLYARTSPDDAEDIVGDIEASIN